MSLIESCRKFVRYMENEIVIDLSPERFTFMSNQLAKTMDTYFYVSASGKKIILSAGEPYHGPVAANKVSIFEGRGGLNVADHELLNQFIRHGCALVLRGFATAIRPTMAFVNSGSLSRELNGQEKQILEVVAKSAGALKVKFR